MNYFKAAEQLLSSVPALEQAGENLKNRLERLIESGKPQGIGELNPDKSYQTMREANDTLNCFLAVTECKRNIAENKKTLEEIYCVLGQLPKEQKELLEMWYIAKCSKEDIMERLYIEGLGTIYALRNRAVSEFALRYFGAAALPSI
jgi:predicted nuclease with TOPRIM domain